MRFAKSKKWRYLVYFVVWKTEDQVNGRRTNFGLQWVTSGPQLLDMSALRANANRNSIRARENNSLEHSLDTRIREKKCRYKPFYVLLDGSRLCEMRKFRMRNN